MSDVAIVTDTTACIPPERVERFGIELVPVQLIFEDRAYRDGIDITPAEFYERLRQAKKMPTSSSSSSEPYLEAFRRAGTRAGSILCLTEPSRFSAMYDSARVAADMARSELPRLKIEVVDCATAAAGQGLVALEAAAAATMGRTLDEIKEIARSIMSRVRIFAALDTLQYLVRSGRVPQAASLVNSILNLKPVFTLNSTAAHTVALPRSMKSAVDRIVKLIETVVTKGQPLHIAVMHADAPTLACTLKQRLTSKFNCRDIFITEFTPVMGVHTGPGLVGVAFYGEEAPSGTNPAF